MAERVMFLTRRPTGTQELLKELLGFEEIN